MMKQSESGSGMQSDMQRNKGPTEMKSRKRQWHTLRCHAVLMQDLP